MPMLMIQYPETMMTLGKMEKKMTMTMKKKFQYQDLELLLPDMLMTSVKVKNGLRMFLTGMVT